MLIKELEAVAATKWFAATAFFMLKAPASMIEGTGPGVKESVVS